MLTTRDALRIGLILALAGSPRVALGMSACAEGARGTRTVAVSGARFSALAGRTEEALSIWSWHDGKRVAVPFQIDACDVDGRVIVGTAANPAPPAKLGTGTVILLRRRDAADPGPRRSSPSAYAVEIAEPGEAGRWLYVSARDSDLTPSPVDEVDYDPARDRVQASRYTLAFERPQVGYFAVADGKGNDGPNLLDRLKARVTATVLWGLFRFHRNEDEVKETVLGYRDGPLRVTRKAELEVSIGWGLPDLRFIAEDHFYDDHAEAPVTISLPFSLAYVFGDLDVRIFLDFRGLEGYEVLAEGLNGEPLRVGVGGESVGVTTSRSTWFLLRRGSTALLHRLHLGAGLESVQPALYYAYDPDVSDPPESVRGERPAIGYRLTGWQGVSRGSYELWMDTYVLDIPAAGDPRTAIAELEVTPRIKVTATK